MGKERYGHPGSFGEIMNNWLGRNRIEAEGIRKIKRGEVMGGGGFCVYWGKCRL